MKTQGSGRAEGSATWGQKAPSVTQGHPGSIRHLHASVSWFKISCSQDLAVI